MRPPPSLLEPTSPPRHLAPRALAIAAALALVGPAEAYIGPGAGFAIGSALLTFFIALLSTLAAIVLWPIRWALRMIRGRRALAKARVRRVIVLGLDGLEPTLVDRFMSEGKLPNIAALAAQGAYMRLGTTAPPLSPVAWSTFLTGTNPGKHNIFDFLTRDPRTYQPLLSSVAIHPPRRVLRLGPYRLPLGRADIRLLRKGRPFWNALSDCGIFSCILRVPITFPPERLHGLLLSAMCVPDLRGTQGTFTYYSTDERVEREYIGGEQVRVRREGDVVRAELIGPADTIDPRRGTMRVPFEVRIEGAERATLRIGGERLRLERGRYTPWVRVTFRTALGVRVSGLCQFVLLRCEPHFELYVTPISLDPERPALPVSYPAHYAKYLAKRFGPYATLGLAEDTWALNAKLIDDEQFLHQCLEADADHEKMFFDALDKLRRGLVVCVLDGPDRAQHMFWRYLDPQHPAHAGQAPPESQRRDAIEAMYRRMDATVGATIRRCRADDVLFVISDHGFNAFRRGVDLNHWLEENGYLTLHADGRGKKYLAGVDWSRTRAYCLGLAGVWLNVRGREAQGIVAPSDAAALREEIARKLSGLRDPQTGETAITRVLEAVKVYRGPYREQAPDLVVAYNRGYRVSWEAAIGQPTDALFHDNTKAWSGDHCIDPKLIPGVLLCNRRIGSESAHLMDLSATVLSLFGAPLPTHLDGTPLLVADADGSFPEPPRPSRDKTTGASSKRPAEAARS